MNPDEPSQKLIGFKPLSVFALEQTDGPGLSAPRVEKDLLLSDNCFSPRGRNN